MNITAVSMNYNIQPVNKRRNNVRFTGNTEQSQPDSFTRSPSSTAKSQETNVNDVIKEVDEVLKNPDSTKPYKEHAIKKLTQRGINSAEKGRSEDLKAVTEKLMSLVGEAGIHNFAVAAIVEMIASNDMKSSSEILQNIETITSKHKDPTRAISNLSSIGLGALKSGKPEIAERIVKILTEKFKNSSNNLDLGAKIISDLGQIGSEALESENPEIAEKIVETLTKTLKNPNESNFHILIVNNLLHIGINALEHKNSKINERIGTALIKTIDETRENPNKSDLHQESKHAFELLLGMFRVFKK